MNFLVEIVVFGDRGGALGTVGLVADQPFQLIEPVVFLKGWGHAATSLDSRFAMFSFTARIS
jgi:hypothetical protein